MTTTLLDLINERLIQSAVNPIINTSLFPGLLVPSNILSNINPMIPQYPRTISYQDVNNDVRLKEKVIEYFFNKILSNWLKYHYNDLYQLLEVSDGKAMLIKNIKELDKSNEKQKNDVKYEYLVENYLRKKDILVLLSKFRKMNSLNWWELKKYQEKVRLYIHHRVKEYMKREIIS